MARGRCFIIMLYLTSEIQTRAKITRRMVVFQQATSCETDGACTPPRAQCYNAQSASCKRAVT
jgi:hypothetical protein